MASTGVSASAGERTISSCLGMALYKHVMIAVSKRFSQLRATNT